MLTVWPWTVDILEQWFTEVRPLFRRDTRRPGPPSAVSGWPAAAEPPARRLPWALGLDPALDFHSLRRSYVTHLIEDGWDPRFVQEQVGHEHASTTSIYTCVSSDYRTRTLRPRWTACRRRRSNRPRSRMRVRTRRSTTVAAARSDGRHRMFHTTELVPLLRDRGIDLSASQVHRLVTGTPERLSLTVLAALCDIFETDPAELITTDAANVGVRRTADGDPPPSRARRAAAQTRPHHRPVVPRVRWTMRWARSCSALAAAGRFGQRGAARGHQRRWRGTHVAAKHWPEGSSVRLRGEGLRNLRQLHVCGTDRLLPGMTLSR